jgi:hypothetical protein
MKQVYGRKVRVEEEKARKNNLEFRVSPNPFINGTIIYKNGRFKDEVYDLSGRKVQVIDGNDKAEVGKKLGPGVYFAMVKDKVKKLVKLS